ncbi:MAG: transcription-repair coupling factor [Planctomycetota bacterium]
MNGARPVRQLRDLFLQTRAAKGALDAFGAGGNLYLSGLWGASQALALASLAERTRGIFLVVASDLDTAEDLHSDLALLAGGRVELYPQLESLPGEEGTVVDDLVRDRLMVVDGLRRGELAAGAIVVASVAALIQGACDPTTLAERDLVVRRGGRLPREDVAAWLTENSFDREDVAESPGSYASRGGILDVFPATSREPYRIEFLGDEVASIRLFDPETQESRDETEGCVLSGSGGRAPESARTVPFTSLLPPGSAVAVVEPASVEEHGRRYLDTVREARGLYRVETILHAQGAGIDSRVYLSTFRERFEEGRSFDFDFAAVEDFPRDAGEAVRELVRRAGELPAVFLFANNVGERRRLVELLAEPGRGEPATLRHVLGRISRGFVSREPAFAVIAHHEMFHRYRRRYEPRRPVEARPIDSFLDLSAGEPVVHTTKGIAIYEGLKVMEGPRGKEEFLVLRFADNARVYVSASQIDLVHKYVGGWKRRPPLSKLQGKAWLARKAQVEAAAKDLAAELLEVQARRAVLPGITYPPDADWQREFEAAFLYEETPDQLNALAAIKTDMQSPHPMDRLVCGDVGYGKTELAVRAAFKAAQAGKQVAVLAPTTLLVEQHVRTFLERLADYPVEVRALDRFRSTAQEREILAGLAEGRVDIVIGTHRLLQQDVGFASLGLVIVDEEQRFGVRHKEILKRDETMVDCLTLTATPIPRTLHLALAGIKDISTLSTAPQDRLSIETIVCRFDRSRVRQAVLRELARGGQVFFVHNRVRTIDARARELAGIVPEARFIVAHGQMHEDDLEEHMMRFLNREADVLVATTIIENGLDIPTANTLFIDRADMFGLAELHQLRGRVGRYKHRAYAYMLLPENRPVTPDAAKRLRAIADHSELGAGFKIAMRDLEIRGAGNLLGPEQSGHIAAVGYELYCRLLEGAVARLRDPTGGGVPETAEVTVDLGADAYITASYIPADRLRMEIYRRLATASTLEDLDALEQEIRDRFGQPPAEVERLVMKHRVRIRAARWGVRTCMRADGMLRFQCRDPEMLAGALRAGGVVARVVDERTVVTPLDEDARRDGNALLEFAHRALASAGGCSRMQSSGTRGFGPEGTGPR